MRADGTVLAAWTDYDGALWMARSADGGASFTAPYRVAGDAALPARAPALALGPGGDVTLAWSVGEEAGAAIRVARSSNGGAGFGAPQLVGGGTGRADAPRLAVDSAGRLHLVYAQQGGGVFHTHAADGGKFAAPRWISPPAQDNAAYPMLAGDGRGKLVVAWENLGAHGRPHSQGLAVSADGGASFTVQPRVPGSEAPAGGSNGSQQGLLGSKLAVAGDGRIVLVNSSLVPGQGSRVWLLSGR